MKPLEASLFKPLAVELKNNLVLSGVVPVNDIFLPTWGNKNKINLFYGSYGSGKSVFIIDQLIDKCLNQGYFRCYFGRKIFDTVRGTVFKTITDRIKELKKESLFYFSDKPNGSMQIVCRANGNEFIPFGANDSSSLKSIKDPTDFFCEELDQFTFEDFGFIFSRLRTEKALTQFWGAFNTERIYQSHWIRKVLFDGEFKDMAFKLKANYYDNHFIDKEDYESKLRLIANGNAAVFNAIANGEWGMVRTGSEFWKQFSEVKHVKLVEIDKNTIHVSLDENVNPYVTVSCWQINTEKKEFKQIHEIPCKSPDNNAVKAAKLLIKWFEHIEYKDVVFIYGDPSASKRSTVDPNNSSFYDKFIETLISAGYKVVNRVMKSAPEVALSAAFINDSYENNLYGWSIVISDRCFVSIEDYLMVKEDADGKMLKPKVKDKESEVTYEPAGHFSDAKRYFIISILKNEFLIIEAISFTTKESLLAREQFYIDTINPFFNICKIAGSPLGIKKSIRTRDNMSKGRKGMKFSDSHKQSMRLKKLGRKLTGQHLSKTLIAIQSRSKPVMAIDKYGNINKYKSAREASKITGVLRTGIANCLSKRAKTAGGYIWNYQ